MWSWPVGAADHTSRHVDRRHITDRPRWGCLRHRWTERRLSWCAILFVSRPLTHRARSAWTGCGPPMNPISCDARRRIRAIENCVSCLCFVARSTTSDDVGSTRRQIESDQSPRFYEAAVVKLHEFVHVCGTRVFKAASRPFLAAGPCRRQPKHRRPNGDRSSVPCELALHLRRSMAPTQLLSVPVRSTPRAPETSFVKPGGERPFYTSVHGGEPARRRALAPAHWRRHETVAPAFSPASGFSTAPSGTVPVSRYRHNATSSFRASATIPIFRKRIPPWPNLR